MANGEMTEKRTKGSAEERPLSARYALLLGIKAPWRVQSAQLDLLAGKVEIAVEWDETAPVCCPECGVTCPRRRSGAGAHVAALDVMRFRRSSKLRVPRSRCEEHGFDDPRGPSRTRASRCSSRPSPCR